VYRTETPAEVLERLKHNESFTLLDVREYDEWVEGHIPGAVHIPLRELPFRLGELDRSKETVVVCLSGVRSARACEYLAACGYRAVNMEGGMKRWPGDVVPGP